MIELLKFYPEPLPLIENERKVLAYLEGDPYIAANHSSLLNDVIRHRRQAYKGQLGFEFASHLDVFHSEMPRVKGPTISRKNRNPNIRLILSARIKQATKKSYGDLITYALAVCRIRSTNPDPTKSATQPLILRKFHFDIAFPSKTHRQEQPISHLQYCGTMIPFMKRSGYPEYQLRQMHSKLSEPRLFFWPMSLAPLLDIAFREFPDNRSRNFRATKEWRGLLHESERLIMRPFFAKCVNLVDNPGPTFSTLSEAFYIK
jgi:hypothetical protein